MKYVDKPFDLSGQVALVTGASSGLGAHFAKVLAAAGACVALCARRADRLQALVDDINKDGGTAIAVSMDVNANASVISAFDEVEEKLGKVSILINNAGVAASAPFLKGDEKDYDFVLDTNLKAVWRVGKEVSERMVAGGVEGCIVNISSILGVQPGVGQTLYATSKAGVLQLTKSMALELGRKGIRVNALCPGYFETEMNADYFATEKGKAFIQGIPPRRLGNMDELTGPLLLLVSEAGSFINGIGLPIDGGHLLQPL